METVDAYISRFPKATRLILNIIRTMIKETESEIEEVISYAIPTFRYKGKNLVHIAGYKNHIGFYATPSGHAAFKEELATYKQGKGSVQFPLSTHIPYQLILRIVKFRINEIKKAGK